MVDPVVMEGRKVRDFEDYKEYQVNKVHVLNKDRKCRKCGLYGCVCQISLNEWLRYPNLTTTDVDVALGLVVPPKNE